MGKRYDKKPSKYRQLSAAKRGKIEMCLEMNLSISEISKLINRSKSTVSEEIRRERYNRKYRAEIAQKRCQKRRCSSQGRWNIFIGVHLPTSSRPSVRVISLICLYLECSGLTLGWGTWIRTRGWRYQKPLPYRLAMPQQQVNDTEFWM